jgi:hypothetical protein
MINVTRGQYNKAVPKARAEAEPSIQVAECYAILRVNQAKGDTTKLSALLSEYTQARVVTITQSRLDDILGSETRNAIASHELIEIVRTTKDSKPTVDPQLSKADTGNLLPITLGRHQIEQDIFAAAAVKLSEFGIGE